MYQSKWFLLTTVPVICPPFPKECRPVLRAVRSVPGSESCTSRVKISGIAARWVATQCTDALKLQFQAANSQIWSVNCIENWPAIHCKLAFEAVLNTSQNCCWRWVLRSIPSKRATWPAPSSDWTSGPGSISPNSLGSAPFPNCDWIGPQTSSFSTCLASSLPPSYDRSSNQTSTFEDQMVDAHAPRSGWSLDQTPNFLDLLEISLAPNSGWTCHPGSGFAVQWAKLHWGGSDWNLGQRICFW